MEHQMPAQNELKQEMSPKQKLEWHLQHPDQFLEKILNHVCMGGTLPELCTLLDLPYFRVVRWVRSDKERSEQYQKSITDRTEWFMESILGELKAIAFLDPKDIFKDDGTIKDVSDMPIHARRAIMSLDKVEEFEGSGRDKTQIGWNNKIKFHNKEKALELLGKHFSMFVDKHEVSASIKLEDIIGSSMRDVGPDKIEGNE